MCACEHQHVCAWTVSRLSTLSLLAIRLLRNRDTLRSMVDLCCLVGRRSYFSHNRYFFFPGILKFYAAPSLSSFIHLFHLCRLSIHLTFFSCGLALLSSIFASSAASSRWSARKHSPVWTSRTMKSVNLWLDWTILDHRCHPCAEAVLIFSVLFQFYQVSQRNWIGLLSAWTE